MHRGRKKSNVKADASSPNEAAAPAKGSGPTPDPGPEKTEIGVDSRVPDIEAAGSSPGPEADGTAEPRGLPDSLDLKIKDIEPAEVESPSPPDPLVPESSDVSVVRGEIRETYRIPADAPEDASAKVIIVDKARFGEYIVELPPLSRKEGEALALLRKNLVNAIPAEATGTIESVVEKYLWETAEKAGLLEIVKNSYRKFLYYILKDFAGFWEIDPLINDDNIEEISLTRFDRPVRVFHRNYSEYMFMETNITYPSEEKLQAFIRRMAQLGGTTISLAQPALEVTLHGPSDRRVTATLGDEISRPGSTYTIRKQKERPLTIVQLASVENARSHPLRPRIALEEDSVTRYEEVSYHKTLTSLMAAYFWLLQEKSSNILIVGETFSGKTTLMNAILAMMSPKAKIVTAEDVLEINLPDHLHWQRMKTRQSRVGISSMSSKYEYGLSDLLKLSLRFSPTILSVGEMRGEESETVAQAITLGHSTIVTTHAEDAERCIQRITHPPMKFTIGHVRDITAIATMRKVTLPDGKVVRRVMSIDEVCPQKADSYSLVNVFRYQPASDSFTPTTPEEVLERSFRLKQIAETFGWTNEHVLGSLAHRASYIKDAVDKGEFTIADLAERVRQYIASEFPGELETVKVVEAATQ